MNNIVLIGMPGTGKSTVGVILAKRLGYNFIDTDLLVIQRANSTLPKILKEEGVQGFLEIESYVGEHLQCEKCVIATGGSMVLSEKAMRNLCAMNVVIWLDTKPEELERRISKEADRGIAAEPGTTIAAIYAMRRPLYEKYAQIRIECKVGVDNLVLQIRDALDL